MSTATQPKLQLSIKNILFATDFSAASEAALPYALELARKYGSKIFITHVIEPLANIGIPLDPLPDEENEIRAEAGEKMRRFSDDVFFGSVPHEPVLRRGYILDVLRGVIAERKIDLLVIGTHGRPGLALLVLGSIAEEILRKSPIPVITIGPHVLPFTADHSRIGTVLFATDFSQASARALPYAYSMAQENNARLLALHTVRPVIAEGVDFTEEAIRSAERQLQDFVPRLPGLNVEYLVRPDSAGDGILTVAHYEHADLIVMGTHAGSAASAHAPWATVHRVVSHAQCPVLTVRW
jgi:nucleotide-binding universal stress UspA family protein